MTKQEKVVELSDQILNFLLDYRKTHPDLRFWLRSRESTRSENKSRLQSGLWFQGTENYIFLSFHGASGHMNMTRSIGWVVIVDDSLNLSYHISVVWTTEPDQRMIAVYKDIVKELDFEQENPAKYSKHLPKEDTFTSLTHFIETILPYINSIIERHGRTPQFEITEAKFQEQLSRVMEIREKISNPTLLAPSNSPLNYFDKMSLNTILFGPPGTGKTFHTVNRAVSIVNPDFGLNAGDRKTLHTEFERLVENGQIQFITFHQSLSYEDFIEGIKPQFDEKLNSMTYPIKAGVFKNICFEALKSMYAVNVDEKSEAINFDALYDEFIQEVHSTYKDGDYPFKTKDNSELRPDKEELENGRLVVYYRWSNNSTKTDEGTTAFPIKKEKIKAMYDAKITETENNLKARLGSILSYHLSPYYAVYKSFLQFVKSKIGIAFQSDSLDDEPLNDDYDGYLQKVLLLKRKKKEIKPGKPYVLIIDEINRGNVSQIFGELLTLIEEDKRLGEDEALVLKLPYSKTDFAVPGNLYIIGTLNTADRSVEALDTALRRRFAFEEMPPRPELLSPQKMILDLWWKYPQPDWNHPPYKSGEQSLYNLFGLVADMKEGEKNGAWAKIRKEPDEQKQLDYLSGIVFDEKGVNLQDLLTTINLRIEKLLNKDQKIGHSYFINVLSLQDVKQAFHNKVLPLLQEYFYGDYGKIGLVVGKGFVELASSTSTDDVFADFEEYDSSFADKPIYRLKNVLKMTDDEFREALQLLMPKPKKVS